MDIHDFLITLKQKKEENDISIEDYKYTNKDLFQICNGTNALARNAFG